MLDKDKFKSIVNVGESLYPKYKKLNITSIYKIGEIYHCEVEEGFYVWVEISLGNIALDKAETSLEIGDAAEVVAKYSGGKPNILQVAQHFRWSVDEEDVWDF